MRYAILATFLLASIPSWSVLGQSEEKPDYREFSKLIHKIVAQQLPKEVEDVTGWGATIPVPAKLPLPNLRKYVKVGDHLELPHGAWRRFVGKIEDADRDLQIRVKEFRSLNASTYRLALDADAHVVAAGEWQQWQKGLMLLGTTGLADVDVTISIVCDVAVSIKFTAIPPEVTIDPKVTELNIDLKNLKFRNIGNNILLGNLAETEQAQKLTPQLQTLLREVIKFHEPEIKEHANLAIARAFREGKGGISASAILKAAPRPTEKKAGLPN